MNSLKINLIRLSIQLCKSKRFNSSITSAVDTAVSKNIEPKKSIINKWIDYWKAVFIDYKRVALDVGSNAKQNPKRAILKCSLFSALGYFAYMNPNEENYLNLLLENKLRLVLIPKTVRNQNSEEYIQKIDHYKNLNQLKYQNLLFISVVYFDEYSNHLDVYKSQCDYLKPSYFTMLKERIIDIGALDYWYFLNKEMSDYDVNPEEWAEQEKNIQKS